MGSLLRCATTPSSSTEMAVSLAKVDGIGRVPAARGRAVALRVEPLSKALRLAPSGGHPSRGLAGAQGVAGLRPRDLAGALANAAIKAAPSSRCRQPSQAGVAGVDHDSGPFPCPGIAGLVSFTGT